MPGCFYALPTDVADASLSWIVSSAASGYPITNGLTLEPDVVAKANSGTATFRADFGSPEVTLIGIALFNVSFPGMVATLTNDGGMTPQAITVQNPEDGLCVNAFWDLRAVGNTTANLWDIAVTGNAVPIAFGTFLPIFALRELRLKWGYEIEDRFPVLDARTGYQKRLQYRIPVRYRKFSGMAEWAEDREAIRTLRRTAQGTIVPWLLLPDEDDPDVFLVQFAPESARETYPFHAGRFDDATVQGVVQQPIDVEEVNAGIALA